MMENYLPSSQGTTNGRPFPSIRKQAKVQGLLLLLKRTPNYAYAGKQGLLKMDKILKLGNSEHNQAFWFPPWTP
jgi:hypothetical protein